MITILVSAIISASVAIAIATRVRKKVIKYVDEMCEINIDQAEKIKEYALSNVEMLVRSINQNKPDERVSERD